MRNIEFPIQLNEQATIDMPAGAQVLMVAKRATGLVLVCRDPETEGAATVTRTFALVPHIEPITRTVIDGVKHDLFVSEPGEPRG